ncbi:hypothetical protein ACO0QE_004305 [Hanseniaspora vineae]
MSNIVNLINPPPSRDLTPEETKDCVPCTIMSTAFALGFGTYLLLGKATEYDAKLATLKEHDARNPKWWKTTLKVSGASLIIFGLWRGTDGYMRYSEEKKRQKVLV